MHSFHWWKNEKKVKIKETRSQEPPHPLTWILCLLFSSAFSRCAAEGESINPKSLEEEDIAILPLENFPKVHTKKIWTRNFCIPLWNNFFRQTAYIKKTKNWKACVGESTWPDGRIIHWYIDALISQTSLLVTSGWQNLRLVLISKFSQNFSLKVLCFSRYLWQKCHKSRVLEQNNCF